MYESDRSSRSGCGGLRLLIVLGIVAFGLIRYFSSSQVNPVTGEKQRVSLSPSQEIGLGLQAAPHMIQQHGGLSSNERASRLVDEVGMRLVTRTEAGRSPYKFDFHLLADRQTVNAFALPGGQIFITEALLGKLTTEGQLAGVLGHEIGHVIERHGAQQMAKAELMQSINMAAVVGSYDPNNPTSISKAALVQLIGQMVSMKYGRNDELESDRKGVEYTSKAGYDPRGMIQVMKVLEKAGGGRQPEFLSTHPNPGNRIERIQDLIAEQFPKGIPPGMDP